MLSTSLPQRHFIVSRSHPVKAETTPGSCVVLINGTLLGFSAKVIWLQRDSLFPRRVEAENKETKTRKLLNSVLSRILYPNNTLFLHGTLKCDHLGEDFPCVTKCEHR